MGKYFERNKKKKKKVRILVTLRLWAYPLITESIVRTIREMRYRKMKNVKKKARGKEQEETYAKNENNCRKKGLNCDSDASALRLKNICALFIKRIRVDLSNCHLKITISWAKEKVYT